MHHLSATEEAHNAPSAPHRQLSVPVDPSVPRECTGHKVRHKSLSNPLIKCRVTDTLQVNIQTVLARNHTFCDYVLTLNRKTWVRIPVVAYLPQCCQRAAVVAAESYCALCVLKWRLALPTRFMHELIMRVEFFGF